MGISQSNWGESNIWGYVGLTFFKAEAQVSEVTENSLKEGIGEGCRSISQGINNGLTSMGQITVKVLPMKWLADTHAR